MNTNMTKQGAYIGAGSGVVLFGLFGLLPGSLLGGAVGVNFAGMLFGLPLESGIITRSIVLASMLSGVFVTGIAMVTATSAAGWLVGAILGSSVHMHKHTLASVERR